MNLEVGRKRHVEKDYFKGNYKRGKEAIVMNHRSASIPRLDKKNIHLLGYWKV